MEDWERKLRELERSIDGERPARPDLEEEAPAAASSTRLLRWTVIGAGAGAGLVVTWLLLRFLLPWLVLLLLVAGVGYGGYRYFKSRDGKEK